MAKRALALTLWNAVSGKPGGKWFFSRVICNRAPYFASINPKVEVLRPGYCEVHARKHRAVTNHIGTFHAIAMCNLAEITMGMLAEATVPTTHRWIPKGMTVEYLRKAETNLRGIAELDPLPVFGAAAELPIEVKVFDTSDQMVFRAVITIWVTPKKK